MPEARMIPDPTLARAEIDARLRALGYALVDDQRRTHTLQHTLTWQHADGTSVLLGEHHVLGERYVVVDGEVGERLAQALQPIPRATLLRELDAAPGLQQALPWLRRLCLLERGAPSDELRERLTRALAAPELFVRTAAMAAALCMARAHGLWALELAAGSEPVPELREKYVRTAAAERARDGSA